MSETRKSPREPRTKDKSRELDFTGERIVPEADNCEPTFASRMFQEHIARYTFVGQLVHGKSVIDVGCGVGYGSRRLAELGASSIYAFDLSEGAIQHAGRHYNHANIRYKVGNAEQFRTDEKFDLAVCFELIEHVRYPRKVLENIKNSLRPEGILVMSTPRALNHKRTHFHEHEFGLEEYASVIQEYFPNLEMFVENNHFASLITKSCPGKLTRIECLKDQFDATQADVFLALATSAQSLPSMDPVLVLDDDAYVRTLERDVEILHQAEDDLKERIEAVEGQRSEELAFKDGEIDRLTADFKRLFAETETLKTNLWEAEQRQSETASKDAEIERLTTEYKALFGQAETLKGELWKAQQCLSEAASKDAEIRRLVEEYEGLFAQTERLKTELWEAQQREAEVLSRAEQYSSNLDAKEAEIARLTAHCSTLREQALDLSNQLQESEMRNAEIQQERDKLRQELDLMSVRTADADSRRLEAYEFANVASNQALALRRELDILKRDLATALDHPTSLTGQTPAYDERHRDIVASMERLFLGTEATHEIVRDPLIDRITRLSLEVRDLRERNEHCTREIAALQEFQRHAEDWHRQLLKIRKSVSWRITTPLRWASRPFRSGGQKA